MTLEDRVRYAKAKLRNIIYYRLEVEPTVPDRFRCQYMHILRSYRKEALVLAQDLKKVGRDNKFFWASVNMIDQKVKTEDCLSTIKKLAKLFK